MLLVFFMLIGTVVILFVLKKRISAINQDVKEKISAVKNYRVDKTQIAEDAGALVAELSQKARKK